MTLSILPRKVNLEIAITELGLKETPVIEAVNRMLMYSNDYGLNIYFDDNVLGIDSNIEVGEIFFEDDISEERELVDYKVPERKEAVQIYGPKTIVSAHAYSEDNGTTFKVSVS